MEIKSKESCLFELKENGFTILYNYWTPEKCQQAVEDLFSVPNHLFEEGQGGDLRLQHSNKYLSTANEFLDGFIQDIANDYSSCNIADRVVGGIVKYSDGKIVDSGGSWHVDSEQSHQFKSLIYLNDVHTNNGPFTFIKKSKQLVEQLDKYSNLRILQETIDAQINTDNIIEITGKAGTCILADSTYVHRGKQIKNGSRYTYTTYFYTEESVSNA